MLFNKDNYQKGYKTIRQTTTKNLKQSANILKKVAITSIAFTTLSLSPIYSGTTYAKSNATDSLSSVYHIYVNDESIGTVNNKEIIDEIVSEKVDSLKKTYKDVQFSTNNLVIIPEVVFHSAANDQETIRNIQSHLVVNTKAFALQLGGENIAYFKDEETAKSVLEQLKLKYVSARQLKEVESRKNMKTPLPPLKEGQSRVLEVKFDKNIAVVAGEIPPNQLLTVEEGIKLLQKGTLEEKKYTVKDGDVLGGIAASFNLSLDELLALNPRLKEDSLIGIGDEINVTQYEPYVHVIVNIEQNKKEAIPFEREVVKTDGLYKGDKKVRQEGKNGQKIVDYMISMENGKQKEKISQSEKVTQKVVNKVVAVGTKVVPSRGTGNLSWPTNGGYVSSRMGQRWGKLHKGIDIARPNGYSIKAADNGVVVSAGWNSGGYGNKIVINHNNGLKTVYAHLSKILVHVGQTVPKGTKIGVMGSTGDSTGTHLHFEVYKNDSLQNPLNYLH